VTQGFKKSQIPADWDGAERRASCITPATSFEQYLHSQLERQAEIYSQHLEASVARIEALVKSTVPDGDLDGHRRTHELWIEEAERKKKFRDAVIEKTLSSLIWAGLALMVSLIWSGLFKKLGIEWPK